MPLIRVLTMVTVAVLGTAALAAQDKTADAKELSQAETEVRVKNDMAKRVGLRPEDARIAESSARIWPDAGLGCNARRGLFEPAPVPGFEIVAEAGGRRFVYHTDRHGRLLRCSTPGLPERRGGVPPRKPIDRIQ
jgi:hypothetical protein